MPILQPSPLIGHIATEQDLAALKRRTSAIVKLPIAFFTLLPSSPPFVAQCWLVSLSGTFPKRFKVVGESLNDFSGHSVGLRRRLPLTVTRCGCRSRVARCISW